MVLVFAGDSTMMRFFAIAGVIAPYISVTLSRRYTFRQSSATRGLTVVMRGKPHVKR